MMEWRRVMRGLSAPTNGMMSAPMMMVMQFSAGTKVGRRLPSCGGEGAFYGFGGAIDDGEQHAAWPFGRPSVLLPIPQGRERD